MADFQESYAKVVQSQKEAGLTLTAVVRDEGVKKKTGFPKIKWEGELCISYNALESLPVARINEVDIVVDQVHRQAVHRLMAGKLRSGMWTRINETILQI